MYIWVQSLFEAFKYNMLAIQREVESEKKMVDQVKSTLEDVANGKIVKSNQARKSLQQLNELQDSLTSVSDVAKQSDPTQASPVSKGEETKQIATIDNIPNDADEVEEKLQINQSEIGLEGSQAIDLSV